MNNEVILASDEEIDEFLAHFGVKGMHWGVRGTRRVQKRLNRTQRVAEGKASKVDRLLAANTMVFTKKGANRVLQRGANHQAKILAGKRKTSNLLATVSGVRVKDLKFQQKGDAKAKMDNGEKAALAFVATAATLRLAQAVAKSR